MRDGINFFRAPSQIVAEPPPPNEVFRIGGLVEEGSLRAWRRGDDPLRVTDGGASCRSPIPASCPISSPRTKAWSAPAATSTGCFEATEILAKHDETYMPAEVIDALKEQGVYQEPAEG
jgi:cytochrome c-type biogenesis protein CcmE